MQKRPELVLFCFRKSWREEEGQIGIETPSLDATARRHPDTRSPLLAAGQNLESSDPDYLAICAKVPGTNCGTDYLGFWYQKIASATRSTVTIQRTMSLARFFSFGSAIRETSITEIMPKVLG